MCHQALSTIAEAHQQFTAIVDTGATRCCISNKDEFETLKLRNYDYELKGIAAGLKIKGEGVVKYDVVDDQGKKVFTLKLRAYYTPDLPSGTRLIPPQNLRTDDGLRGGVDTPGNEDEEGNIDTNATATMYTFNPDQGPSKRIEEHHLRFNPSNNLPFVHLRMPNPNAKVVEALNASIELTSEKNKNLTIYQKELLA